MGTRILLIFAGLAIVAAAGGAWFIYSGIYNVGATAQHTAPVFWLLNVSMRRSVERRARDIRAPELSDRALIDNGLRLYRIHCVQCHGAPGVAPDGFALGMMPAPANLALTARDWKNPAELFWVIKDGIKMSGMPAWEFRMADAELWAVVAFLYALPSLSPQQYRDMSASPTVAPTMDFPPVANQPSGRGDAQRGQVALQQYACVSCHVIPGVVGAQNPVGPTLAGMANRKYLAGVLPNTPDNMMQWLRAPQDIAPGTAMPNLGVTERDARDMATFLGTLK